MPIKPHGVVIFSSVAMLCHYCEGWWRGVVVSALASINVLVA